MIPLETEAPLVRDADRHERNHQGIGNVIPAPGPEVGRAVGDVKCRRRLGGLFRYYYRAA